MFGLARGLSPRSSRTTHFARCSATASFCRPARRRVWRVLPRSGEHLGHLRFYRPFSCVLPRPPEGSRVRDRSDRSHPPLARQTKNQSNILSLSFFFLFFFAHVFNVIWRSTISLSWCYFCRSRSNQTPPKMWRVDAKPVRCPRVRVYRCTIDEAQVRAARGLASGSPQPAMAPPRLCVRIGASPISPKWASSGRERANGDGWPHSAAEPRRPVYSGPHQVRP